jgi:ribosome-associated protein
MGRKTRKGYYVEGRFVPFDRDAGAGAGEAEGDDAPSRTALKEASTKLQALGEELLTLREDLLAELPLPEQLRDAIAEAKRITDFGGLRRQKQYIGRLMHRLEEAELAAVDEALRIQKRQSAQATRRLHLAERWRDELIADDARLGAWLEEYPGTDAQQLRALIRQARKDARAGEPGKAARQGRAYRQIFVVLSARMGDSGGDPSG